MERLLLIILSIGQFLSEWAEWRLEIRRKKAEALLPPPPPEPPPPPPPPPPEKSFRSGRGIFMVGDILSDRSGHWRVTKRIPQSDHVEYHAEKVQ